MKKAEKAYYAKCPICQKVVLTKGWYAHYTWKHWQFDPVKYSRDKAPLVDGNRCNEHGDILPEERQGKPKSPSKAPSTAIGQGMKIAQLQRNLKELDERLQKTEMTLGYHRDRLSELERRVFGRDLALRRLEERNG